MNLENIMIKEISRTQKDKYHIYEIPRIGKFMETKENRVYKELGGEENGKFNGHRVCLE